MKAHVAWLTVLLGAATPAQELTPEVLLLARIKVHMEQNLNRLPNYTCLQTIERSRRLAPGHKFELVDALRLEVAMVGNKELFAWPGAKNFEDRDLHELVQGGAIGNGNFGLHARSIFSRAHRPILMSANGTSTDGRRSGTITACRCSAAAIRSSLHQRKRGSATTVHFGWTPGRWIWSAWRWSPTTYRRSWKSSRRVARWVEKLGITTRIPAAGVVGFADNGPGAMR
jgi:hypothetical protein